MKVKQISITRKIRAVGIRTVDYRATQAVKAALHRAKVCKKPIAGYDEDTKKAYIEYPDGEVI